MVEGKPRCTPETPLHELGAAEALVRMRSGGLGAVALATACLARIAARDRLIQAWESRLTDDAVLEAAHRHNGHYAAGAPCGPLCGLPVGIKDVIDTGDLPTEYGSPIYRDHLPDKDADCVSRLRAAGAIIIGKTVTCEFANYPPSRTRNPHDITRTPGGSSSGSAAAVADFQVPVALGTQTAGSIIRPAAFNGVIGFKPTFGAYSLEGVMPLAPSLDTLGFFARRVSDLPAIHRVLRTRDEAGIDGPGDRGSLRIGIARTPWWEKGEPNMQRAFDRIAGNLSGGGASLLELELPPELNEVVAAHEVIFAAEAARELAEEWRQHPELIAAQMRERLLMPGAAIDERRLSGALESIAAWRDRLSRLMSGVDVLLTPAAIGEAPRGLGSTGDPIFNRAWTALHVPCLCLPIGGGASGMPLSVQLVGHPRRDVALIDAASGLAGRMHGAGHYRVA